MIILYILAAMLLFRPALVVLDFILAFLLGVGEAILMVVGLRK